MQPKEVLSKQHYVDLGGPSGTEVISSECSMSKELVAAHSVNFLIRALTPAPEQKQPRNPYAGVTMCSSGRCLSLRARHQTLHVARHRACCCTYDSVVIDRMVDGAQNGGLAQLAAGVLDVTSSNALAVSAR